MKLYEISDAYLSALEQLPGENISPEVIGDTLEGLLGTFEQKALSVAAFILNLESEANAVENAMLRMEHRLGSLRSRISSLRDYLCGEMERMKIDTVKNDELVAKIRANPPKVEIYDEELIPTNFWRITTSRSIMKTEIAEAIKSGKDVPGSRLLQMKRVSIQ